MKIKESVSLTLVEGCQGAGAGSDEQRSNCNRAIGFNITHQATAATVRVETIAGISQLRVVLVLYRSLGSGGSGIAARARRSGGCSIIALGRSVWTLLLAGSCLSLSSSSTATRCFLCGRTVR